MQSPIRTHSFSSPQFCVGLAVSICLILNFITAYAICGTSFDSGFDHFLISCLAIGALSGEVILLTLWAGLGSESAWSRLPRSAFLFVAGFYAWMFGVRFAEYQTDFTVYICVGGIVLFLTNTSLALAWRRFVGRHIALPISQVASSQQFSLRSVLIWVSMICVLITAGKILEPQAILNRFHFPRTLPIIMGTCLFCAYATAASLPLVWVLLTDASSKHFLGLVTLVILISVPIVPVPILLRTAGLAKELRFPVTLAFVGFGFAACLISSIGLSFMRLLKFRFISQITETHSR